MSSRRAPARSLQRAQQLHALLDVLEDVREDRDVDRLVGRELDRVGLHVRHARMCEALARELEHPRARVDRDDVSAGTLRNVVRKLALAAADVEHPLALVGCARRRSRGTASGGASRARRRRSRSRRGRRPRTRRRRPAAAGASPARRSGCARTVPSHSLKSGRHTAYGNRMRKRTQRHAPADPARDAAECPAAVSFTSGSRALGRAASRGESARARGRAARARRRRRRAGARTSGRPSRFG